MISAIFIDRPRLAFVISIVITLAGIIAITVIPIAQFPDIIPPQVTLTAIYPGADAEVMETTVAQPIEAPVNGVDKALYFQSTSGADGTYTLNVTFALGTDPDINTVNVQNRATVAQPQLPAEVSREGLTIRKKSAALLQVIQLYSPNGSYDSLYLSNYATINILDPLSATRSGSGSDTGASPQCIMRVSGLRHRQRSHTLCGCGAGSTRPAASWRLSARRFLRSLLVPMAPSWMPITPT